MPIPWGLIANAGIGILNFFIKDKMTRISLKKQMFAFIGEYDKKILDSVSLRDEDRLIREKLKRETPR